MPGRGVPARAQQPGSLPRVSPTGRPPWGRSAFAVDSTPRPSPAGATEGLCDDQPNPGQAPRRRLGGGRRPGRRRRHDLQGRGRGQPAGPFRRPRQRGDERHAVLHHRDRLDPDRPPHRRAAADPRRPDELQRRRGRLRRRRLPHGTDRVHDRARLRRRPSLPAGAGRPAAGRRRPPAAPVRRPGDGLRRPWSAWTRPPPRPYARPPPRPTIRRSPPLRRPSPGRSPRHQTTTSGRPCSASSWTSPGRPRPLGRHPDAAATGQCRRVHAGGAGHAQADPGPGRDRRPSSTPRPARPSSRTRPCSRPSPSRSTPCTCWPRPATASCRPAPRPTR